MCRFLLANFSQPTQTQDLLNKFADMCRLSKSLDGDDQGDGWGVVYWQDRQWHQISSLKPIWLEVERFSEIPETSMLVAHARSASFPDQKGILAYNQPFVSGQYAFVFNGLVQGVKLPRPIPGRIGSQKIWYLVREFLQQGQSPQSALRSTTELLRTHSQRIQALNLGLATPEGFWASCDYDDPSSDYYQLQTHEGPRSKIICSEPLPGYDFQPVEPSTKPATMKSKV
jgi:predicted glutamine amidotransferase